MQVNMLAYCHALACQFQQRAPNYSVSPHSALYVVQEARGTGDTMSNSCLLFK